MKVSNNITIFAGMDTRNTVNTAEQEKQNGKSLYAGSLNEDLFANSIWQKKKEAQEKAMKVIGDVWAGDRKIDEDLQSRQEHIEALQQQNKDAQDRINEIDQTQEDLKAQYGVTEDSKEQQDLELLRRKRDMYCNGGKMSGEEFMQTVKLEKEGLTEYQLRQLELDDEKAIYQETIDNNEKVIMEENAIIRGTRMERLKHAPMVKARKQAEEIMADASEEIIGMVVEDAKAHIDEEQEKREEKAEELKEQRKEQEEFIENRKEKRKEQEELLEEMPMEEMLELNQAKVDIQKEVQNIMNEMKLVAEDIKGAMVDESL